MTALRISGRGRILVLIAHGAALLGGLAFALDQWADVRAQQAVVNQIRQTVEQLDRRLAASDGGRLIAGQPSFDPFLPGASAAVAGANLQDRVVSAIRMAGGGVTSSQLDTTGAGPSGSGTAPPTILLTVTFQLGNAALQGLLYALESGAPALFVEQISIDGTARSGGEQIDGGGALKISMIVSAYWTGDGKS